MKNFNLPNLLTMLRLAWTPLFAYFVVQGEHRAALICFLGIGFSDFFDGWIARAFHQKTRLGAILDPVADKAFMATSFVLFAYEGWIPWVVTGLVLLRDVVIVATVTCFKLKRLDFTFQPILMSKLNTLLQLWVLLLVLLRVNRLNPWINWRLGDSVLAWQDFETASIALMLATLLWSWAEYALKGVQLLREQR